MAADLPGGLLSQDMYNTYTGGKRNITGSIITVKERGGYNDELDIQIAKWSCSSIHCLCMCGFPGFVGNLETTVILVRVADCCFVMSSFVPRLTLVGNFWPGNKTNMTVGGGDSGPHDNKEGKSVLSVVATVHAICYRKGHTTTMMTRGREVSVRFCQREKWEQCNSELVTALFICMLSHTRNSNQL